MRRAIPLGMIRLFLALAAPGFFLLGPTGCDIFKPDHDMYGDIKNLREFRMISWNPKNHEETYSYQPNDYRYFVLEGSTKYEFRAWLPDGTITDQFTGRLNEIKDDRRLNGVDIDWLWEIGGGFYACVSSIDPGSADLAKSAVTLTAVSTSLPPPPVVNVTADEMASLRADHDASTHRQIARDIHRRRGAPIPRLLQEP